MFVPKSSHTERVLFKPIHASLLIQNTFTYLEAYMRALLPRVVLTHPGNPGGIMVR